MTGALKKLYGARDLHERGFTHAWVMDAESVALREFSFEAMFTEYAEHPRLLRTNMSSRLVSWSGPTVAANLICMARALNVSDSQGLMSYHATDYWFYVLSNVAAMMQLVQRTWQWHSFASVYARYPAFEYHYYGTYMDRLAPP